MEQKRLDEIIGEVEDQLFVKIDVGGMELNVLYGMERLFEKNLVNGVVFEFNPEHRRDVGNEPEELLEYLLKNGFIFYSIDRISGQIKSVNKNEILREELGPVSRNIFAEES